MADKNLLVPGTAGTKLLLNGNDIGWPGGLTVSAWLAGSQYLSEGLAGLTPSASQIVATLSMEHADTVSWEPSKTTLVAGGVMKPGPILNLAYNQFQSFDTFPYDWRADIRRSGELLLEKLQSDRPKNGRWRLVGHSQGGLVIIAASKRYAEEHDDDDEAFSSLVSHVVLLATPLFGTVNAAASLVLGENLAANFRKHFLKISSTWPALYQMLPSWEGSVRVVTNGQSARASYSLLDDQAWAGINVDQELLRRARATQAYFRSPLSRMNGVKKRIIMSRAYQTLNHVRLEKGEMSFPIPPDSEPGDTLVPEDTTFTQLTTSERENLHSFEGTKKTMQHFVIANDPAIATDIKAFFRK